MCTQKKRAKGVDKKMTNVSLLKSFIVKNKMTMKDLAKEIGISETSLSYKANNKREFTATEIDNISRALGLSTTERDSIFFNLNVE